MNNDDQVEERAHLSDEDSTTSSSSSSHEEEAEEPNQLTRFVNRGNMVALRELLSQEDEERTEEEDIDQALMRAIQNGNVEACGILFNSLSESGRAKYRRDDSIGFYCALHFWAVSTFRREVACFLIQQCQCNINQLHPHGFTPLFVAVVRDDLEMTSFLLEQEADPNGCRGWIQHPLSQTIARGNNTSMVRLLLDYGADPNFQRGPLFYPNGGTVLPAAAMAILAGNAEALTLLLQHGAILQPAALGSYYGTVLLEFCESDDCSREDKVSTCRALWEHAEKDRSTMVFLESSLDSVMREEDKIESLELLFDAGITPPNRNIHRAVREGHETIFRLVLRYGWVDPFQDQQGRGTSLFHYATKQKNTKVLGLLLDLWDERFASNGGKNDNGDYPIHVLSCIKKVSVEAIKLVLERQGRTSAAVDGEQGMFPFHFAALWGSKLDVLYTLVRHCPDAVNWVRHGRPNSVATAASNTDDAASGLAVDETRNHDDRTDDPPQARARSLAVNNIDGPMKKRAKTS